MTVLNTNKVRLSSPIEFDSVVNGDGLRIVIWFQGCLFACPGCHNQDTWAIDEGFTMEIEDLLEEIESSLHKHVDGITLSGGDPMFQSSALKILVPRLKDLGLNIWMYSGEIYENLLKDKDFQLIKDYLDVIVDGRFVESKKDLTLDYRGSSNQRLIDVQKTIAENKIIQYKRHS